MIGVLNHPNIKNNYLNTISYDTVSIIYFIVLFSTYRPCSTIAIRPIVAFLLFYPRWHSR
ncbi:hypothetical protein D3790_17765 [Xenorhabdus nematophila]|nr:hypothetical protein D3790_17765 [Xenorhabdus nematophila]MCB4426572.1 hypothetical protein [Xenorhabdus nematophila]CEF28968.1 hypothetical protein XNW1_1470004 [Xenorhabdus nematophila str. Websteri]CEF33704.1 hypothetical protein XNW1_4900004 [Xenorhabdus nematophila str. Websteri]